MTDWSPIGASPDAALVRRRDDARIAGVCGALGRRMKLDSNILRVGFVVMALAGGAGFVFYLGAWLLLPSEGGTGAVRAVWPNVTGWVLLIIGGLLALLTIGGVEPVGIVVFGLLFAGIVLLNRRPAAALNQGPAGSTVTGFSPSGDGFAPADTLVSTDPFSPMPSFDPTGFDPPPPIPPPPAPAAPIPPPAPAPPPASSGSDPTVELPPDVLPDPDPTADVDPTADLDPGPDPTTEMILDRAPSLPEPGLPDPTQPDPTPDPPRPDTTNPDPNNPDPNDLNPGTLDPGTLDPSTLNPGTPGPGNQDYAKPYRSLIPPAPDLLDPLGPNPIPPDPIEANRQSAHPVVDPSARTHWAVTRTAAETTLAPDPALTSTGPPLVSITFASVLALLGVALVLNTIAGIYVGAVTVIGAATAIIGLMIAISAFKGRTLGLIPLAFLALPLLAASPIIDHAIRDGIGSTDIVVRDAADLAPSYRVGIGELQLDLSSIEITEDTTVEVEVGTGAAEVRLPPGTVVDVRSEAAIGYVYILGEERAGIGPKLRVRPSATVDEGEPRLHVIVSTVIGSVDVDRGGSRIFPPEPVPEPEQFGTSEITE